MQHYKQIKIAELTPERRDLLIALLSNTGFDGFEESENELKAFGNASSVDMNRLQQLAGLHEFSYSEEDIQETNWNALWESNFDAVTVGDFAGIRAHFHQPFNNVQHEILITPKMSFGTGHHATTFMMIEQMSKLDFAGKHVFDFGTGTGVLAILAEKLGAASVTAIDNDEWSIENAKENADKNHCTQITVTRADTAAVNQQFDIILANINKNVLLENMAVLASQLKYGGTLLMSGLLREDEQDIVAEALKYQLQKISGSNKLQWIALVFAQI